MSGCNRCGAGLILLPAEILCRDLGKEVLCGELARLDLAMEASDRDLVQRRCIEICSDLAKRSLTEILPTKLL